MKLLIQRVMHASVEVAGKCISGIGPGALVFIGITHEDTVDQAMWIANKLVHLRMFEDKDGKMNYSLLEQQKQVLVVSQFTLYGDFTGGRRPSFFLFPEQEANLIQQQVSGKRKLDASKNSIAFPELIQYLTRAQGGKKAADYLFSLPAYLDDCLQQQLFKQVMAKTGLNLKRLVKCFETLKRFFTKKLRQRSFLICVYPLK